MTTILAVVLSASVLLNMALLTRRRARGRDDINVFGDLVLPRPDDPDWREAGRERALEFEAKMDEGWWQPGQFAHRALRGLEFGSVRVEKPDWDQSLNVLSTWSCLTKVPLISVDGYDIGASSKETRRYVVAVWTAYFNRRVVEGATVSPLLGTTTEK